MNKDLNFNEYRLKYLASGGYAKLYIASPKDNKKPCLCIKFLKQTLLQSPVHTNRFQQELSLLKNLHYSGLPQLTHDGLNETKLSGFTTLYHDFLKGQPETYQEIF